MNTLYINYLLAVLTDDSVSGELWEWAVEQMDRELRQYGYITRDYNCSECMFDATCTLCYMGACATADPNNYTLGGADNIEHIYFA
jgi:hypothetical protein